MDDQLKEFYFSQIKEKSKVKRTESSALNKKHKNSEPGRNDSKSVEKQKPKVEVVEFKRNKSGKRKRLERNSTKCDEVQSKHFKPQKLLEQLQWDVTSFGLQGFSKDEKRRLEEERAVKLGAKPRKRPYVNYKLLMEERKKQNIKTQDANDSSKSKKNKQKTKSRSVFWQDSIKTKTFGQVGNFQNGVLKISSFNVKSVKQK